VWFGFFGLVGNLLASRYVDRVGAARAVDFAVLLIAASLLAWPLVGSVAGVAIALVPWALACFSAQSMQQARLNGAAPALAPALMALNTSAIYLGQAAGASSGGWLIAEHGYAPLSFVGLVWLVAALALSVWASRAMKRGRT
jgi:predicted MFS family arabinose efflux permease